MIFAVVLLITGVEMALIFKTKKQIKEVKETQAEVSPTPSPLPSPKPTSQQPSASTRLDLQTEAALDRISQIGKYDPSQVKSRDEELLKILPPKEQAELERAIRETQQVLKNVEVFNFTPPSIDDINKGFNQINKQTQEQIKQKIEKQQQEFQQKYQQEIDIDKMMERLNQNPPAVPQEGKEFSPEQQEYYYRKNILKDPAVQY